MQGQQKYESDMTKKEKRELERKKLSSMNFRQKAEYIWMYYKPAIAAAIGVCFLIFYAFDWYENSKIEDILYVAMVNTPDIDMEAAEADFKEYLGDTDEYHRVTIDATYSIIEEDPYAYANEMKITTLATAGDLDILIANTELCKRYIDEEYVADWHEVLGDDYAKYEERISGNMLAVNDSAKLEELGIEWREPSYMIVLANIRDDEVVRKYLEYCFQ